VAFREFISMTFREFHGNKLFIDTPYKNKLFVHMPKQK
jgi:hypothetical protein